ncbi:MAG: RNA polymerase sigma factor [Candidatus Limnocylindrales bacterium]
MDQDLVVRAQQGDQVAFARLADAVYGRFQQLAFRILRDRELARDATQQATLSMWRKLPQLRDPARFEAWAYRTLVNECYTESKRRRRSLPAVAQDEVREPSVEERYGTVADRDQLERAFGRITLDQRVVLVMRHYLGLSTDAIAEALGVPAGTVKSRLDRGLRGMRRALEADARPGPGPVGSKEVVR